MKKVFALFILLIATSVAVQAQEKGVDQQNDRIRDNSTNRAPAVNGGKLDTGAGRGMDFGRGRTIAPAPIPNPYRLSARRDAIIQTVRELMSERKLILDESASKPSEGVLISQPYTFIRGAVVAASELSRYAEVTETTGRGWTRGRYTLTVEIQPIDGISTNVSVNARIEGRAEAITGTEWLTLRSTGIAEEEFLSALIERVTGAAPPGREPQQQ
ncbi:MAG TPA: hypothetical protein VNA19_01670 [Pyrinomonadaceae bacterium]|nr:hypothetical protein [Pyrinomonadaceae bacterium]